MILSMYINSDFSGWDEPENNYPIEWLIDYVRVYKDKNGYDENDRLNDFQRFIKDICNSLTAFGENVTLFFENLHTQFCLFLEQILSRIPALYTTKNSN